MKRFIYLLVLFIMCLCVTSCSINTNTNTNSQENKELKIYAECIDCYLAADHNNAIYYFDYDKFTNYFWTLHPNAIIVDYEFITSSKTSFWKSLNSGDAQIIIIKYYE